MYEFFKVFYAREVLTTVVFFAAITVAFLTDYEFVKLQHYVYWAIIVGCLVPTAIFFIVWLERIRRDRKIKEEIQKDREKDLAHRFHIDIFQNGDLSAADEILSPDFIWRNPSLPAEQKHGPDGVKKIASAIIDAMPNRQITHEDTIVRGDKVMIRWTMTGTPKKEVLGIPPSDKPVTIIGFDLFRLSGDKIVEMWSNLALGVGHSKIIKQLSEGT